MPPPYSHHFLKQLQNCTTLKQKARKTRIPIEKPYSNSHQQSLKNYIIQAYITKYYTTLFKTCIYSIENKKSYNKCRNCYSTLKRIRKMKTENGKKPEPAVEKKDEKKMLRKQLDDLLSPLKDKDGKIRKDKRGYLKLKTGKKILTVVNQLDLSWLEIEKLLGYSKSTVEKMRSHHNLKVTRKEHLTWTDERLAVVKEHYEKSQKINSDAESGTLRDAMIKAVNKLAGVQVSIVAIRCKAKTYDWGKWGYNKIKKQAEKTLNNQPVKNFLENTEVTRRIRYLIEHERVLIKSTN